MSKIRHYNNRKSFFFRSPLTDKRKDEIINWVKSLTDDEYKMLLDIIQDSIEEYVFNEYDVI